MDNTSDINNSGFLGNDVEKFKDTILTKYNDILSLSREFNGYIHSFRDKVKVGNQEIEKIAVVTLFIKAVETYQAIYVLLVRGITNDAETLCRVLYETMVKIAYCCKNNDCFRRYLCGHYHQTLKLINSAIDHPDEFGKEMGDENRLSTRKGELCDELKEMGGYPPVSTEEMARQLSNRENTFYYIRLYQGFFRLTSDEVHSAPKSLEKYIGKDKNQEIRTFLWGPRENISLIFTSVEFMLSIIKILAQFFDIDIAKDWNSFNSRYSELFKKYFPKLKLDS